MGAGLLREEKYENKHFKFNLPFNEYKFPDATRRVPGHCEYTFTIYPSVSFSILFDEGALL